MSRVVVGIADRASMDRTLAWAITEAAATRARLLIVRAEVRESGVIGAVARGAGPALAEFDPVLARAIATARTALGEDRVGVTADRRPAGAVLVSAARAHDLVVVGPPTVSGWWGRGSTTYHVMTRSLCPVVAVHDPPAASGPGRSFPGQVVVGVRELSVAHAVLEFAFAYADQHRVPVVATTATRHPVEYVWFDDRMLETHLGWEPPAAAMLATAVEPWQLKFPAVDVRRAVVGDDAAHGLRRVSRGAALLVLGTAADRSAPLGRVGRSLVESAACPVAVVRVSP